MCHLMVGMCASDWMNEYELYKSFKCPDKEKRNLFILYFCWNPQIEPDIIKYFKLKATGLLFFLKKNLLKETIKI